MFYGGISNVPGAPGNVGAMNKDNQSGRDIVEETRQRQFPQFIPPQMGSSNVQNAMPGGQQVTGGFGNMQMGNMGGMQQAQGLPGGAQGPAQGPNTPVRNYPGMGYAPYGPGGGGMPPTPMAQVPGQVPPFDKPVR